jgi:hypothetical protein
VEWIQILSVRLLIVLNSSDGASRVNLCPTGKGSCDLASSLKLSKQAKTRKKWETEMQNCINCTTLYTHKYTHEYNTHIIYIHLNSIISFQSHALRRRLIDATRALFVFFRNAICCPAVFLNDDWLWWLYDVLTTIDQHVWTQKEGWTGIYLPCITTVNELMWSVEL